MLTDEKGHSIKIRIASPPAQRLTRLHQVDVDRRRSRYKEQRLSMASQNSESPLISDGASQEGELPVANGDQQQCSQYNSIGSTLFEQQPGEQMSNEGHSKVDNSSNTNSKDEENSEQQRRGRAMGGREATEAGELEPDSSSDLDCMGPRSLSLSRINLSQMSAQLEAKQRRRRSLATLPPTMYVIELAD